ncbi:DUF6517 family protein [Salarchaeum sp. JOR-1]|uniref:DUF6517 family protein n=1 Tax=Salarchaeum sp. JOR-1 TaxID=2599399 RepID=UPI00119835C8|nr:DUF6517 family protein [Salarchaeum sp. JOR-1]QDX40463.1 hypothetical protein FQU85_05930 [Salarchaeum sp. JOR-1]
MNRRTLLGASAGLGLAGLAGCSTLARASVSPPDVPTQEMQDAGWKQTDSSERTLIEQSYGPVTFTAKGYTTTYTDAALNQRIQEATLGRVTSRLALFSATRIDFSPDIGNLPGGIGQQEVLAEVEASARAQFRDRLTDAGLSNVERTGTGSFEVATGESASLTEYKATYKIPTFEFPVTNSETVTIDGETLTVRGDLAVWHHGDYGVVAGGAWVGENFARSVTEEISDAITVSVDVDLDLEPGAYQQEIHRFMRQTS